MPEDLVDRQLQAAYAALPPGYEAQWSFMRDEEGRLHAYPTTALQRDRDWHGMSTPIPEGYEQAYGRYSAQDLDTGTIPGARLVDEQAFASPWYTDIKSWSPEQWASADTLGRDYAVNRDINNPMLRRQEAFSLLGSPLFGAMLVGGLGASAGLAAAPLVAGGAGLGTTLGSLGTLSGVAGTGAGIVGQATDQDWLKKVGLGLGALGGIAGGVGGLANLWGTGVTSLSDAAKLASSAGKVLGGVGRASGVEPLQQASKYLGYAGQAGNLASGAADWLGWSGTNSPPTSSVAPELFTGAQPTSNVSNLLGAADVATQRGGGNMSEWDYSEPIGPGLGWDAGGYGLLADYSSGYDAPIGPGLGWDAGGYPTGAPGSGLSLEQQVAQAIAQRPDLYGTSVSEGAGGGASFGSTLMKLLLGGGQAAAGALSGGGGGGGGILGPLLSSLGSLGSGAIGSNAANEAARLQSQALNRGLDLSTSQWLQQLERTAPWVQAGQQALGTLQGLSGQQLPGIPGVPGMLYGEQYAMPGTTPGWSPQNYQGPQAPNAGDYRWTPQQGPSAAAYRYTPGQTPDAAAYASAAPQLFAGAMPGTQVPTLQGQQVLDQDPGVAFRQSEARRALEGSAAARGDLLSGGTLQALQSRSQDLASQEYQNAWQRMMARNTEQYGRDWGQYQQNWQQGVTGTQLGLQTNAQNFQQAQAAAALREQVNQVASQQGWNQATAEAVFREQQAQLASQQGWNQALQGQQNAFTQGLDTSKWNTLQQQQWAQEQYKNQAEQAKYRYAQDLTAQNTAYDRGQNVYRQQLAQSLLPWEQQSTLASLGAQVTGQLGNQGIASSSGISNLLSQLGSAQGTGAAGQGLAWTRALGGAANQLPSLLAGLNA